MSVQPTVLDQRYFIISSTAAKIKTSLLKIYNVAKSILQNPLVGVLVLGSLSIFFTACFINFRSYLFLKASFISKSFFYFYKSTSNIISKSI